MATQGHEIRESGYASGDMTADQYKFVVINSDGEVEVVAEGAAADAVLLNKPYGKRNAATLMVLGRTKTRLASAVTAGDPIAVAANGFAKAAATGNIIVATAIESGVADQYITIDFFKGGNAAA